MNCVVCFYQQIRCFMGFSITGCVLSVTMFICYSIALAIHSEMKTYCSNFRNSSKDNHNDYHSKKFCYDRYNVRIDTAENVAGLGSCLLIFSLVELVLALASSIYCCKVVCCTSPPVMSTVINYHQQFSC